MNVEQPSGGREPTVVVALVDSPPIEVVSSTPERTEEGQMEEDTPTVSSVGVAQPVVPSPAWVEVEATEVREIVLMGGPP